MATDQRFLPKFFCIPSIKISQMIVYLTIRYVTFAFDWVKKST